MDKKLEELEVMRRAVGAQNERWALARAQILALGDCVLAVPRDALERIAAACAPPVDRIAHPIIRV